MTHMKNGLLILINKFIGRETKSLSKIRDHKMAFMQKAFLRIKVRDNLDFHLGWVKEYVQKCKKRGAVSQGKLFQ